MSIEQAAAQRLAEAYLGALGRADLTAISGDTSASRLTLRGVTHGLKADRL